jgi:hypothetical protein
MTPKKAAKRLMRIFGTKELAIAHVDEMLKEYSILIDCKNVSEGDPNHNWITLIKKDLELLK